MSSSSSSDAVGSSSPSMLDPAQPARRSLEALVEDLGRAAADLPPLLPTVLARRQPKSPGVRCLVVRAGALKLALPLQNVTEVRNTPNVTPLPFLPPWVAGVANLRGDVVSIVDFGDFLRVPPAAEPARFPRLVVVRTVQGDAADVLNCGLSVDHVDGARRIEVDPTLDRSVGALAPDSLVDAYTSGATTIDDETIRLVDLERLLASEEFHYLESV
ncbi:MAG: chemotaxis protein CheW [Planctomycetia bacterium]